MRVAALSDIHSNWPAMSAVLEDADAQGATAVWCLGDVTGYGPDPYRCWQELAEFRSVPITAWVVGNHDWGLIGRLESKMFLSSLKEENPKVVVGDFGQHAWDTIVQQRQILEHKPEVFNTLGALPVVASPVGGVYLTHGTFDTELHQAIGTYAYVPDWAQASLHDLHVMLPRWASDDWTEIPHAAAAGWQRPLLMLVGHTHRACAWQAPEEGHDGSRWSDRTPDLREGPVWFELVERPVFANPGSVGFPRDCDPTYATYMLIDWQETRVGLWLRRVKYNVAQTIAAMRAIGIAEKVISQLEPTNRGTRSSGRIIRGGSL